MPTRLIAILGPTASGKSAVAVILAETLGGEIVSCDSMQVYRGLDLGTAKPSAAEQARIPHHLVDVADPRERYDVSTWRDAADEAVRDILARGRQPLLCGGTGLYARALLAGFALPPHDPEVAAALRQELAEQGPQRLTAELAQVDPESAGRVAGNHRRLLRALEAVRLTGQPLAAAANQPPAYAGPEFVLTPEPEWARQRIRRRCARMLAEGWIEETRRLVAAGLLDWPTAGKALGYPQVAAYLRGEFADVSALVDEISHRTWQYARRQRTWFRHQHPAATPVPVGPGDTAETVAERILARLP